MWLFLALRVYWPYHMILTRYGQMSFRPRFSSKNELWYQLKWFDSVTAYFPKMWLKHKSIHGRCHWWNFKFFDCKSGISLKFGIWWYINHPIWGEVKFFKSAWIFQCFAFYGLACADIQILTPDLESPQNFAYSGKETILFGLPIFFGLVHQNAHTH